MKNVNIGDRFIAPHATDWTWNPTQIEINRISEEDGRKLYFAECSYHDYFVNSSTLVVKDFAFEEKELFPCTKEGLQECKEYINNYYYAGYCIDCKYNKLSENFFCESCVHCEKEKSEDVTKSALYRCKCNGLVVGSQYSRPIGKEICKYYESKLPQEQALFRSWEDYLDVLQNCDFNKDCPTHKLSCHKTCDYQRYLNNLIPIALQFDFDGRKVTSVKIARKHWMEQDFLDGDLLKCYILNFSYRKNKRGLPRKEDLPTSLAWETQVKENTVFGIWRAIRNKEVIIDIKKGEVVGVTGEIW